MSDLDVCKARTLIGWNQSELARRAGLTKGAVHDIESGRNKSPSHETVTRIVRAFRDGGMPGITAEQLFPIPEAQLS